MPVQIRATLFNCAVWNNIWSWWSMDILFRLHWFLCFSGVTKHTEWVFASLKSKCQPIDFTPTFCPTISVIFTNKVATEDRLSCKINHEFVGLVVSNQNSTRQLWSSVVLRFEDFEDSEFRVLKMQSMKMARFSHHN